MKKVLIKIMNTINKMGVMKKIMINMKVSSKDQRKVLLM